ncbi:hypothetical protein [Actinacidiphila glaucinigra]|uniref:hypothetical protein n=1 Tax=Actinacidiphila glaucinigra TaxID=235986 RepID=UPI003671A680
MSRRTTARRQAQRRRGRADARNREALATLAEWRGVTERPALGTLAARNVASTRAAVSGAFASTRAALDARPVTAKPCPPPSAPKTILEAAMGPAPEPEPVKAPEPVIGPDTPAVELKSIKAADLDDEMRAAARRVVQGNNARCGWRVVGVWNRDSDRVKVWVRAWGASVRYAISA